MPKMSIAARPSVKFIAAALFLSCAGCATTAPAPEQQLAEKCGEGVGTGLAVPPTAETRAAMAAHDAATKMSLDEILNGVARGDAAAQIELGLRYMNGKDVVKNSEKAISLFETAGRQGNPLALYFIGTAYSNGIGLPMDDSRAVFLWEEAARQGYPLAQYWLGFMISSGRGGIESDWCAAVPFFMAAAAEDHTDAAFMLGAGYHMGKFGGLIVPNAPPQPDYKKAAEWYRKATSKQLNQKAQYNLRLLIESYQVDWQQGDPGKPPPPKPAQNTQETPGTINLKDKTVDSVG